MNKVRSEVAGYTIVETLIFLAVSGLLFLTAMLLVNGQQQKTQFTTSVREFDAKLRSVIGNVTTGYYNNSGQTLCTESGGVITVSGTGGLTGTGTNANCTFIGQYIYLEPTLDAFTTTSYVGLRRIGTPPREVQNLAEANETPFTDTAERYDLPGGMTASMRIRGGTAIDTLKITTTFNQYGSGNTLNSGSSRYEVHAFNSATSVDTINPATGVQICLDGGDRVGIIVLSGGTTNVSIGSICP